MDPRTGMKNYIANESIDITTSSAYIRNQLQLAIRLGRDRSVEKNRYDSMRHLGAALHTLEGATIASSSVAAHINDQQILLRIRTT